MLSGKIHYQCHFGFRYFIRKYATFSHTILMHMQHNLGRITQILVKKLLKDMNNKFHRREIVVQQ